MLKFALSSGEGTLAQADSATGAADGCPMFFANSWAVGWSRDM
jgi:hypothetical protein